MSTGTRRNQAAWEKSAIDLGDDLASAADRGTHSLAQVADRTGLSMQTIRDSLYRSEVTEVRNPRTYLCRPRYRINSEPYWSDEQVEEAARAARRRRTGAVNKGSLPLVDPGDDMVGIRDIAAAVGYHEHTVRKWRAGTYTAANVAHANPEPFPPAAGRRAQPPGRRQGNPETMFERAAVHRWLATVLDLDVPRLATPEAAAEVYAERLAAIAAEREAVEAQAAEEAMAR